MSGTTPATPAARTRIVVGRRRLRTGIVVVVFLILGFALLSAVLLQFLFSVSGEEFSPQTFERRRFSYIRLPYLNWQVTGIAHTAIEAPVEESLTTDKLITPRPKDQTWDCIVLRHGAAESFGDARILTTYLDANAAGDVRVWLKWTESHPECAKVFWPVVMQTAEEGMYLLMPELFTAARGGKEADPAALVAELKRIRVEGYKRTAEREAKLQHPAAAAEFYRRASNLSPEDAELQEAARRTKAEAEAAKKAASDA